MTAARPALPLAEALADPQLLGVGPFASLNPWRSWLAFCAAADGEVLDAEGAALFERCAGRPYAPRPGGYAEVAAIVGRQSGKTQFGAACVVHAAAFAPPERAQDRYALLIAQDHRASMRAALAYCRELLTLSPVLRREVAGESADSIRLHNGCTIAAYPARPAAVRGLRALVAVADELAFFVSTDGRPTDLEMLRALRPTLATTGGRLFVLSSPYGASGALYDLHRRHHGREDAPVLVWQADAPTMHPTLSSDYLERMRADDPEAYRSEVLGEFRAGLALLLDPEALAACVVADRPRELPPIEGARHLAFADPSGGRSDAFALAIAHAEGQGDARRCVVDVVRRWSAPFNPSGVVAEAADLLVRYRVARVTGDRYAGEWPREGFRAHGISYDVAALDRSALYLALLPAINAQQVELPDDPVLLRELRGLERSRGSSGRDRVDHRRGAHDDVANACAGAVHLALGRATGPTWASLYGHRLTA